MSTNLSGDSAGNEKNYVIGDMFHFEGETGVTEPTRSVTSVCNLPRSVNGDEAAISSSDSAVLYAVLGTPTMSRSRRQNKNLDWKTGAELGGAALDKTDKNHLKFSPRCSR